MPQEKKQLKLDLSIFVTPIQHISEIEMDIVKRKGALDTYYQKWNILIWLQTVNTDYM